MIDVLDLQPEVVAELKEAGVCKFLMEIVIDTDKANCQADVKVVRDTIIPSGLNSFCAVSPKHDAQTLTAEQQRLFARAVEAGLMERRDDGYLWKESKALLAYFCGRVFCGDYAKRENNGTYIWEQGKYNYPMKRIERIFSIKGTHAYRSKRYHEKLPDNFEAVDALL